MTEITRIARKKRQHVYLSRELMGAYQKLSPAPVQFSPWVEAKLWHALIDEHGEDAVLDAVEDVKADISPEERLNEPGTIYLEA